MDPMNDDSSEQNVYKDLVTFLESERSDLRKAASEAVLSVNDRYDLSYIFQCMLSISQNQK